MPHGHMTDSSAPQIFGARGSSGDDGGNGSSGSSAGSEELQRNSEWLGKLLSSIGDAVVTADSAGRVTFLNSIAEELTGWPSSQALGQPLPTLFHLVDRHSRLALESPLLIALREQRVASSTHQALLIARDGTERPIDATAAPLRDADGARLGVVLVFRDVGERLRVHEAQARLAAIVESSEDAVISKTLGGIIQSWNGGAERLFGYSAAEAIGRSIELIIPPDRLDEEREIMAKLRRGERVEHFETLRATKSGRRVAISLTVSPIRDAMGVPIGASKVARDITDRVRTEEALREVNRRKDEFLPLLAHELRSPLAPLRNGIEILRLAGGDARIIEQTRAMMERQLGHMVRLVDDLLDVSRISRNKMELRRSTVLFSDVVSTAVETARPAITAAGHELTVELPREPVRLDADLTRLAQVFANLLNNSAKYTPHGGRIHLSAERRGGELVVEVRDTGIGIPAEALPRIFEMFSQVDRSVERSSGGLGIGLALVRGLVEMHGGTVTAGSQGANQGSTFTVRLPAILSATGRDGMPASEASEASPLPARPVGRVLVVDDNRDSALSMSEMLRLMGYETRTVHDGLAALDAAERFRPEIVLMDVGMPLLNGYDATRRLREKPWGREITIVALTGWGQEIDKVNSRQAGCDAHLVKPIQIDVLETLLAQLRPVG
jgi:PAS domain S-box-containing protein